MKAQLATSILALTGPSAFGDKPVPQTVDRGIKVLPQRIASIGADFRLTSEWYDYGTIAGTSVCSTTLSFDAFDPDSLGHPAYGNNCDSNQEETTRWFFGSTYCNMFSTNDMAELASKEPPDRLQTAWWWQCAGQTAQSCFIAIQFFDMFDKTCNGPDRTNFVSGLILAFGPVECSPDEYYYTDIDLCEFGIVLPVPAVKGAYDIVLAQAFDSSTGTLTMADCAQPMLWGTDGHGDPSLEGPGTQNGIQWDDDNPVDGTHTPIDECYDHTFALCPNPLGSMLCLYAPRDACPTWCNVLSVPDLIAGSDAFFTGCSQPHAANVVRYAFETQAPVFSNRNGFCAESELSPPLGNGVVFVTTSDETGHYEAKVPVPPQAEGVTIYVQSFASGTCPDPCESAATRHVIR